MIAEKICVLLKLNIKAGLGLRLAEAEVKQDATDPNLFYIRSKDIVDALGLANALSILAEKIMHLNIRFRSVPILAC